LSERDAEATRPRPRLLSGLFFGLRFLPVAALLLYLYSDLGLGLDRPYLELQATLARPILNTLDCPPDEWLGRYEKAVRKIRYLDDDRMHELGRRKYLAMAVTRKDLGLPLITFIALVLATGSFPLRRRLLVLGIGLAVIVLSHAPTLALLFLEYLSRLKFRFGVLETDRAAVFYGNAADVFNIFSEILPFILWFLLTPVRRHVLERIGGGEGGLSPG
jgi:hypothetical protein